MKQITAVIAIIFISYHVSAQTIASEALSMNTGSIPARYSKSNHSKNDIAVDNNDKAKTQTVKGMNPLLLLGNSILINPDPAADMLTIVNDELPVNEIRIENLSGQLIADKKTNANVAGEEMSMDVSALPSGIYFITTLSGDRTITGNIVVIR